MKSTIKSMWPVVLTTFWMPAHAGSLPTQNAPSRKVEDGNWIQLLQNYAYDIFIFGGLALATLAFFVVVKNVLGAYSEISTGKSTWGQVAMHAGVGVLLLILVVYLLTEAAKIL